MPGPNETSAEDGLRDRQITVFLAEDHVMFRTHLARLITKDPRMTVCGESDNTADALRMIEATEPDLLLVDISLRKASGLELIREVRTRASKAVILVLSMHDESMYAERALRAGASGYLSKHQAATQLREAIEHVLAGGIYLSARMTTEMLRLLATADAAPEKTGLEALTDRELEVFRLLGQGLTTAEIAERMQLAEKTVHSHRLQIKTRLSIRHTAELYHHAAHWVERQQIAG